MLAWMVESRLACSSCGTRRDEWKDEDDADIVPAPYVATTRICPGCERLEVEAEANRGDERTRGAKYLLVDPATLPAPTPVPTG